MPRLTTNFINTKIEKPETGKTVFYRDSELTGFGLKVTAGAMSYIVESRVSGNNRRISIGNAQL